MVDPVLLTEQYYNVCPKKYVVVLSSTFPIQVSSLDLKRSMEAYSSPSIQKTACYVQIHIFRRKDIGR
jgi:hypothetical protein